MGDSLRNRVLGAIHWSFNTWRLDRYEGPNDISITPIAGELYHVTFTVITHGEWTVHALYLDTGREQASLFFDSDTHAIIASFVEEDRA